MLFAFSLITEGTTEKVLQFMMPLKSIYNKNLAFIEHDCIFEHYREVQTRKTLSTDIIFITKEFSDDLFRATPYRLMLVLHKDVLFHCIVSYEVAKANTWYRIANTFAQNRRLYQPL
jgi:hypothetical protein